MMMVKVSAFSRGLKRTPCLGSHRDNRRGGGGGGGGSRGGGGLTCLDRLKMAAGLAGLLWRGAMLADGGLGTVNVSRRFTFSTGKPE